MACADRWSCLEAEMPFASLVNMQFIHTRNYTLIMYLNDHQEREDKIDYRLYKFGKKYVNCKYLCALL